MYITLTWSSLNNTKTSDIEAEIEAEIKKLEFVHVFSPYDGVYHASVKKGESAKQIQKLCNRLVNVGADRYSFVITLAADSQALWRSPDMTDQTFAKMEAYVTG